MNNDDYKKLASENNATINFELLNLEELLQDNSKINFKNVRNITFNISKLFKELKPLLQEDRDKLWSEFNNLRDLLKKLEDDYYSQCDKNRDQLDLEISVLSTEGYFDFSNGKLFWGHVNNIKKSLQNIYPIRKNDRDSLWYKFNDIVELKKEVEKNERLYRENNSSSWFDKFHRDIEYCRPTLIGSITTILIYQFDDYEYLKECSQNLKQVREAINDKKEEMLFHHRNEIFDLYREVQEEINDYFSHLKGLKQQKHQDYQEKLRENLADLNEKLSKAETNLERIENSISDLSDQINESTNDNWISKAEGWLSEHEEKRDNINEYIERLESWIEEAESKLD